MYFRMNEIPRRMFTNFILQSNGSLQWEILCNINLCSHILTSRIEIITLLPAVLLMLHLRHCSIHVRTELFLHGE